MRRLRSGLLIGVLAVAVGVAAPPPSEAIPHISTPCAPDAVRSGDRCLDKYEASVWEIPPANSGLILRVKMGIATLAHLTSPAAVAGGVVQRGVASDDYGAGCPGTGNGCTNFYAVSIPGVTPSRYLTWFQAAAAARNAGKRLPTNAEWQAAALGTPDGAPCIVGPGGPGLTGTAGCVSDVGAFDMVGNLWELVADWVPFPTVCPGWGAFSDDYMCLAGASTTGGPGALFRGGSFGFGTLAGVFAVAGDGAPSGSWDNSGFRAARPVGAEMADAVIRAKLSGIRELLSR